MADYEFSAPTDQEGGMSSDSSFRAFDAVSGEMGQVTDRLSKIEERLDDVTTRLEVLETAVNTYDNTPGLFANEPGTLLEALNGLAAAFVSANGGTPI